MEKLKTVDELTQVEINRIREAGELSRAVSDDIERETRRYPRTLEWRKE